MTKEELLLQIHNLSEEDQQILRWELVGSKLRPWADSQQIAYLLDVFACPEGHTGPFSHFYLEGITHLIVKEPGEMLPAGERFETQSSFDIRNMDGIYCETCGEMGIEAQFWVPEYVLKHFFEKE